MTTRKLLATTVTATVFMAMLRRPLKLWIEWVSWSSFGVSFTAPLSWLGWLIGFDAHGFSGGFAGFAGAALGLIFAYVVAVFGFWVIHSGMAVIWAWAGVDIDWFRNDTSSAMKSWRDMFPFLEDEPETIPLQEGDSVQEWLDVDLGATPPAPLHRPFCQCGPCHKQRTGN